MSTKDYNAIAQILNIQYRNAQVLVDSSSIETLERITTALAYYFKEDNPRFDKALFCNAVYEGKE